MYYPLDTIGTVPRAYKEMEEETIKIMKLKIGKCNTTFKFKKKLYILKKQNSTISLPVKWEVCEKSTFLSLCLAKGAVGV
jgi:hypothetical protein